MEAFGAGSESSLCTCAPHWNGHFFTLLGAHCIFCEWHAEKKSLDFEEGNKENQDLLLSKAQFLKMIFLYRLKKIFSLNYGKQIVLNHVLSMYMCVLKPPKKFTGEILNSLIWARNYTESFLMWYLKIYVSIINFVTEKALVQVVIHLSLYFLPLLTESFRKPFH